MTLIGGTVVIQKAAATSGNLAGEVGIAVSVARRRRKHTTRLIAMIYLRLSGVATRRWGLHLKIQITPEKIDRWFGVRGSSITCRLTTDRRAANILGHLKGMAQWIVRHDRRRGVG